MEDLKRNRRERYCKCLLNLYNYLLDPTETPAMVPLKELLLDKEDEVDVDEEELIEMLEFCDGKKKQTNFWKGRGA